jgi:hypothetical protein
MKRIITVLVLFIAINASAQENGDTKVEQYCEVVATPKLLSAKVTIDVDYGDERSFWKDNRLRDEGGKLKKFNTTIDALNYLGKQGWKLVNAFPVIVGTNSQVYHYVLKREFLKSETEESK